MGGNPRGMKSHSSSEVHPIYVLGDGGAGAGAGGDPQIFPFGVQVIWWHLLYGACSYIDRQPCYSEVYAGSRHRHAHGSLTPTIVHIAQKAEQKYGVYVVL